mmetsp:Transcript_11527/g.27921  ORF Transcript_11527/g.27921 Transcript_11527/m.27921 type:complete len:271 (-) Transcript_11527:692-1504(-)
MEPEGVGARELRCLLVLGDLALDRVVLLRVYDDKREEDAGLSVGLRELRLRVAVQQLAETDELGGQLAKLCLLVDHLLLLLLDLLPEALLLALRVVARGLGAVVANHRGEALPPDILLVLRDDVHRGQHVEGVVSTPSDVLLVAHVRLLVLELLDQLVGHLVVRGGHLMLHLSTHPQAELPQPLVLLVLLHQHGGIDPRLPARPLPGLFGARGRVLRGGRAGRLFGSDAACAPRLAVHSALQQRHHRVLHARSLLRVDRAPRVALLHRGD